jgi:arylsulfatase A-like enzyme
MLRPKINDDLPATEITLAAALKKGGYTTAHIGKWHLGGEKATPQLRGFDVNIAGDHTGTPLSYFAPYENKNRTMPGLENAPAGEYLTDRLTTEAEAFIATNKDKPFFLYFAHYAPHTPLRGKPDKVAKYKAGPLGQQGNPHYAAMLESLDESVGRVLKKLDDLKLTDNTIVIFTSDNGGLATLEGMPAPATINNPLREGKGYLYEGGIRVPLLVKWPGVAKPGTTSNEPVSSIDFFPTLLAAAGVAAGANPDGYNLRPVFAGEALKRQALYWHYPHYANQGGRPGGAIRVGNYKMIEYYEYGRRELFDVVKDPGEGRNLAHEKPELLATLSSQLAEWRNSIGASKMEANPKYVPNPQGANGTIVMHARSAQVHGVMLRYEPLPHKETLGYWVNADDWASFEFTVTNPGKFTVEVLQGCGKGQGGSEVAVRVLQQELKFTVEDTGHFQNFKPRDIGMLTLEKPGSYLLTVKPLKKAAAAVMDIRQVTLKPVKTP